MIILFICICVYFAIMIIKVKDGGGTDPNYH